MITLLLIAVIAILIASLVYASKASTSLPSDKDLETAKSRLVWVSVVGWLSVSILVIFMLLLLFEGAELLIGGSMTYLLLFVILGLLVFTAWLTVSATSLIGESSEFLANKDRTAAIFESYNDAYLASALSLGTIIALILMLAAYYAGRWSVSSVTNSIPIEVVDL